jgi:hypothetical protein
MRVLDVHLIRIVNHSIVVEVTLGGVHVGQVEATHAL